MSAEQVHQVEQLENDVSLRESQLVAFEAQRDCLISNWLLVSFSRVSTPILPATSACYQREVNPEHVKQLAADFMMGLRK
jgi:hypothetical protein